MRREFYTRSRPTLAFGAHQIEHRVQRIAEPPRKCNTRFPPGYIKREVGLLNRSKQGLECLASPPPTMRPSNLVLFASALGQALASPQLARRQSSGRSSPLLTGEYHHMHTQNNIRA
jgi:hypothetical protein